MKISRVYSGFRISYYFGYALLFSLIFISCKREKPPIPDPLVPIQCWEKFEGTYIVYDTANATSWIMTINHIIDTNSFGYLVDYLVVDNFANNFDFQTQFTCRDPSTELSLGFISPATSFNGKRYNLDIHGEDLSTPFYENNLDNDTIVIYYCMENTAYWMVDGVQYIDTCIKHIAVKQH